MRKKSAFVLPLLILVLAFVAVSCSQQATVRPPVAKIDPKVDTLFDHEMVDNYYWLRDETRSKPDVIEYLEAENAYTEAMMGHREDLQDKLYEEMVARIKETDLSVPVKRDDYYYYSRTEEGKQYQIYCRKQGSLEAEEEVLLDVNRLAEGKQYMSLGIYQVSPDHKLLAYAVDTSGNERYTLRVKNLETGEIYPDVLDSVAASMEWANDNRTIFYTVADEAWRPYKLFRHKLGDDVENDVLVYHEPDEAFWLDVTKTKDMKYLFIELGSETSSEVHYVEADRPTGSFKLIHARTPDLEYDVYHHDENFYMVTNDDAKNFKLVRAPVSSPSKDQWKEVVGHRDSVKLDHIDVYKEYMALYEREDGLRQIRVREFDTGETYRIEFDEPVYSVFGGHNPDFNSRLLRFTYISMVTPRSVFDYDMKTKERELKKRQEVLGGYDPEQYQSERIFATAEDGTRIPISIVYRKGTTNDGSNPLYLYGYGAYGMSMDPYFSSNRLSLLDRGFIFAMAHVRGGGEMGRYWYDDGKLLNKKNTFTDFIAVAEHLISESYTSSDKLVISGGSAGGLLIGAVVNMRPDLFKVAVADVPFVDLMNTMLDETIPLTVIEYEEWGNPNEREYFEYMLSYSPYDNVRVQDYPNMLITGSLNDPRVQYWEPAKWTAKLRAMKKDDNRLLLRTNMGAGHGGASGRYSRIEEIAFEYAFILDVLGIV
jgi:oligopeptidase B